MNINNTTKIIQCGVELQQTADMAVISVLFFSGDAKFWTMDPKNA